jgi:hypothetical protein
LRRAGIRNPSRKGSIKGSNVAASSRSREWPESGAQAPFGKQQGRLRMLIKLYGEPPSSPEAARRYSPSECVGTRTENVTGSPDPKHVSTSYAERGNLTMRMAMRRFTRLTNAFSKKLDNHAHMVALYALWYNFVRVHKSLRVTPAMAAGIETRLWSMEDVVKLIEWRENFRSGALLVG